MIDERCAEFNIQEYERGVLGLKFKPIPPVQRLEETPVPVSHADTAFVQLGMYAFIAYGLYTRGFWWTLAMLFPAIFALVVAGRLLDDIAPREPKFVKKLHVISPGMSEYEQIKKASQWDSRLPWISQHHPTPDSHLLIPQAFDNVDAFMQMKRSSLLKKEIYPGCGIYWVCKDVFYVDPLFTAWSPNGERVRFIFSLFLGYTSDRFTRGYKGKLPFPLVKLT